LSAQRAEGAIRVWLGDRRPKRDEGVARQRAECLVSGGHPLLGLLFHAPHLVEEVLTAIDRLEDVPPEKGGPVAGVEHLDASAAVLDGDGSPGARIEQSCGLLGGRGPGMAP